MWKQIFAPFYFIFFKTFKFVPCLCEQMTSDSRGFASHLLDAWFPPQLSWETLWFNCVTLGHFVLAPGGCQGGLEQALGWQGWVGRGPWASVGPTPALDALGEAAGGSRGGQCLVSPAWCPWHSGVRQSPPHLSQLSPYSSQGRQFRAHSLGEAVPSLPFPGAVGMGCCSRLSPSSTFGMLKPMQKW